MKRLFPSILTVLLSLAFVISTTPSWSAGTLEVTSPNGGDSWKRGETYTIEWDKGNAGRFVKIQLLKTNKLYKLISRRTKNDGSYKWKIPSSVKSGVTFKVKIKSISKKTVFDASNRNFRIRKATASTCSKSLSSGCGWTFTRSQPIGAKKLSYIVVSTPKHPVHYGKKSERFMVKPGWCTRNSGWDDCPTDRERSEMSQPSDQKEGDEYWYRWSIYFPKNHRNLYPTSTVYGQFHQHNCRPVFMFKERTGGYWLNIQDEITGLYDDPRKLLTEKEFVGYWNDIVVHARWTKKNDGWLKVWVNGRKKATYRGRTMTCKTVYFKYGVYRSFLSRNPKSKKVTTIAYYDGVVRSKSKKGMFDPLLE